MAASILSPDINYSLVALPLYYGLCLVPHCYSLHVATGGNPLAWDNRNSRSPELTDSLKKKLDKTTYGQFERARSAHFNSLESFPLFASAVLLANMARVDNEKLNTFVLGVSAIRALYILSYINIAKQEYTPIRSVLWVTQLSWNLHVLWQVGKTMM